MQSDELVEKAVKSAMLSVIKEHPMGHWRDDQVKEVARRAITEAALSAAEPSGYVKLSMPGETWHSWKTCAASDPGARPFYFSAAPVIPEWEKLDEAFSNFINAYGDPFKPKRNHEKETERNIKVLGEAFNAFRSALSVAVSQSATAVAVKALKWDEFSTELKRHFQSNTILGQYQIAYLGEFECWQLYSPQKSATWKENFSRHKSSEEAKAAAQADYESRIRSALSAQVQDVAERGLKEIATWEDQQAFEAWAQGERYEMHQHPLHYLFMDPKTNAARQGWKAALQFIRDRSAAAPAKQEG